MNATPEDRNDSLSSGNPESRSGHQAADTNSRDVVDVVNVVTSGGMYLDSQAAAALEAIQTADAPNRFLQHWDAQARTLTFGFGNGTTGVTVCSSKKIQAVTNGVMRTRMRPSRDMLDEWLNAAAPPGKTLLASIESILRKYLYFDDDRIYLLMPLWMLGTYVYSMFTHYGYLHLYSSTPRCGKTRVQELIQHLAFEATQPLNAPTAPVIRDYAAEGGTVQLDTLERWPEKNRESFSAAMELLDAGFRAGGTVSIKVPKQKEGWRTETLTVYAPYSMAGIHKHSLSDTALDRAFSIPMKRKRVGTLQPFHSDRCAEECAPLRDQSYAWALQNAETVASVYQSDELNRRIRRLGLSDRAADIWKPLIAIANVAGLDHREISALESLAIEMNSDPEAAENARQVAVVRGLRKHIWERECPLMTNQVVELLNIENMTVSEAEVSSLFREWQIEQKSARVGTDAVPRRCWILGASILATIEEQLQGWLGTPVQESSKPPVPESSEGISPQNTDYGDYTNEQCGREPKDQAIAQAFDDEADDQDWEDDDGHDEEMVSPDHFDIGDEEQEAIDAMVTWRERDEWPPLRHELHELERILDREMGRDAHGLEDADWETD